MNDIDPRYGAHFDLSLELGFAGDDQHIIEVSTAFWACPQVDGPWDEPRSTGTGRTSLVRDEAILKRQRYGRLCPGDPFPTLSFALAWVRENGVKTQEPSDWLTLGLPVAALKSLPSFDGSWTTATQPWVATLCRFLAGIADEVHRQTPIAGGVLGEEASGCWRRPTPGRVGRAHQAYPPLAVLSANAVENRGGFLIPSDLWEQLAPKVAPIALPSGLYYAPPQPLAPLTGA